MSGESKARLFTVPLGAPFLKSLAEAILAGGFPTPETPAPDAHDLSAWRIYVPTRRAATALRQALLEAAGGALLLPRITPLGDPEEDELMLTAPVDDALGAGLADLPPAISPAERRLVLIRLIMGWSRAMRSSTLLGGQPGAHLMSPAQAAALAGELARLMDEVDIGQTGWHELQHIVPDSFADNWRLILEFLKIVTEHWPDYLDAAGMMAPMARRNALIEARAAALSAKPPTGPVIAAGSTGSVPATARLLRAIAHLPRGAVVLPGLDRALDEPSWAALGPDHPQFGMKHLLDDMGIEDRAGIALLPGCAPGAAHSAREQITSELMRPAPQTHQWAGLAARLPAGAAQRAMDGVELIAAPDPGAEARMIAMIMRGTLETPGRSCALVTPDRNLARRVAAELGRWGLTVENSSGTPLRNTGPGIFLLQVIEVVESRFAPHKVLALLKHRLFSARLSPQTRARGVKALDLAVRGIGALPGLDGLARTLAQAEAEAKDDQHAHPARKRLGAADWAAAKTLIDELERMTAPLSAAREAGKALPLAEWLSLHAQLAGQLALEAGAHVGAEDQSRLWAGRAGQEAAAFFAALHDAAGAQDVLLLHEYAAFLDVLMRETPVRPHMAEHPRLFIWGTLEARLMQTDVMILGGLNEGVWPAVTRTDPWLSRPMRADMQLEPLERRIGLAAHDFAQFIAAPKVYLTRAEKVDGTPSVPSRWLLRLKALLGGLGLEDGEVLASRTPWLSWGEALSRPEAYAPRPAPQPRPALALRPTRLSVTEIEKWIRDPYEIYAAHVLKLEPLDEIAAQPDARHKGIVIHEIMEQFAAAEPQGPLDAGAEARLMRIAARAFETLRDWPDLQAYWRQRFAGIAAEYLHYERALRERGITIYPEKPASYEVTGPHRPFTLRARADRIDIGPHGAAIYDYKTGQPPSGKMVHLGLAPQMPLEAALLALGAFEDVPAAEAIELIYLQLKGGQPAMKVSAVHGRNHPAMALATRAMDDLKSAIALYENPETPYVVRRMTQFENRFTPYDHLARTKEWRLLAANGEDGA